MTGANELKNGRILLAVDGSLPAKTAVYAATQIAAWMQWSLHALYVVDVTQVFEVYSDTNRELSELSEAMPQEEKIALFEEQGTLTLAEVRAICQQMKVPLTTEMIFGGVADTILAHVEGYNLLALGRRGNRHREDGRHLGSNFQQIAHRVRIPMIIGGDITPKRIQRMLLAYNGSEAARKALVWAENLQAMLVKIITLCVENEKEQEFAWLEDRHIEIAESHLLHYEFVNKKGNPGQIIASIAFSREVDLILMGCHQRLRLFKWFQHSSFETVLGETGIPVLATN